ncbi:kinesin-domain-containing protein [Macrolepiota fuliginosa MF-IS2]|uniref:Kinesin-like protein n=1 Tax=Macrolepiota fuliginosa MF-IS2 TaxID=1400762 RepID=A0A9P5XLC8_9AGAR|nr:kinesin-domain-containing protein [Macrolepiota fuliginosa MF-IS2]
MATRASARNKPTTTAPSVPTATRTTRTRTTPTPTALPTTTKRTATTRKPPLSRDNSRAISDGPSKGKGKPASARKTAKPVATQNSDREPIMAYLRIRPHLGDEELTSAPYLTPLSDTTVRMTDPQENQANRIRYRSSVISGSSLYTFSHIFPPETTQSDFFTKTTLPLVHDALQGQNGLLFTYGVTNSGKTYTVQGGNTQGSAGILPRTLDVIFNSIDGLQGDGKYRPVRLYGIEPSDANDTNLPQMSTEPALAQVLGQLDTNIEVNSGIDPTAITVDRNYEYTVWISYVEVYNEKVYDLLDSVKDESSQKPTQKSAADLKLLLTRKALPLRPSPTSDNEDVEINGKYIAGLRQFRVTSAAQAKSIVKLGQLHRRVFGTLANHQSSRSHGMVIIKIVRGHRGEKDDPTSLQVSRLTLVDLAGSERTKHTHTTGERLKEAGNINKSLMVLGQCMEVMRSNQKKLASSLAQEGTGKDGRMDTRDVRKTLAVIPFRHSKLTEALMDYFTGEGRAVMIVNVNPYDTGYDENSHVMKFSSLAREIYITNAPAPVHKVPSVGPGKLQGQKFKDLNPMMINDPDVNPNPFRRKVTITMGKKSEAVLEVVEEDEPADEVDDNDDEPLNPLIDALFDEVEDLRMQLFEAEMRCALIEAETREEVMREMEDRMRLMEEKYSRRLMSELVQNELKTDAKIDLLHKAGLFGSPVKKQQHSTATFSDEEEEEEAADVEMSLINRDEEGSEEAEDSQIFDDDEEMPPSSPLAEKSAPKRKAVATTSSSAPRKRISKQPPQEQDTIMSDLSETENEEEDEQAENSLLDLEAEEADEGEEEEEEEEEEDYVDDDDEDDDDDDYEEEWKPPKNSSSRSARSSNDKTSATKKKPTRPVQSSSKPKQPRVPKLEREMEELSIKDQVTEDPDESVVILPRKAKVKKIIIDSDSEVDDAEEEDEVPSIPVVKKKRQLGKKPVMTVDNIERVTWEVEKKVAKTQGTRTIRRLTGH